MEKFLRKVAKTPVVAAGSGRLIFAMDATASREPTWDRACQLQAGMFDATSGLGALQIQLCYYRGFNQFHASPWCDDTGKLQRQMTAVRCLGGHTQIERLLTHAMNETRRSKVQALVFVGDAVEEAPDRLCHLAGQLGMLRVPLFMFQEGHDPRVRSAFRQIAQLSGGAFAPFDMASAEQLRDLLRAVAVFAVGGRKALAHFSRKAGDEILRLTRQLK